MQINLSGASFRLGMLPLPLPSSAGKLSLIIYRFTHVIFRFFSSVDYIVCVRDMSPLSGKPYFIICIFTNVIYRCAIFSALEFSFYCPFCSTLSLCSDILAKGRAPSWQVVLAPFLVFFLRALVHVWYEMYKWAEFEREMRTHRMVTWLVCRHVTNF